MLIGIIKPLVSLIRLIMGGLAVVRHLMGQIPRTPSLDSILEKSNLAATITDNILDPLFCTFWGLLSALYGVEWQLSWPRGLAPGRSGGVEEREYRDLVHGAIHNGA
jgi:hypothetical protein